MNTEIEKLLNELMPGSPSPDDIDMGGLKVDEVGDWARAVEEYIGLGLVEKIEVYEDPEVKGTFAIQITDRNGDTMQFLYIGQDTSDPEYIYPAHLAEVEFTTWPPESGRGMMRFFP